MLTAFGGDWQVEGLASLLASSFLGLEPGSSDRQRCVSSVSPAPQGHLPRTSDGLPGGSPSVLSS